MRNIDTKLFIHVPFSFRKTLKPFSKFVLYTTYSPEKTLGYAFLQHTEAYREFSETLTRMQIPFTVFREETIYSPEDYEQAPFMRLHIEHEIDQVLPVVERRTCPVCGGTEIRRGNTCIRSMHVPKGAHAFSTFLCGDTGGGDILLTEEMKERLMPFADSSCFVPIEGVPLYLLSSLPVGIGDCVPPTKISKNGYCPHCGSYEYYLIKSPMYFDRSTWGGQDMFLTKEKFGSRPPVAFPIIVVTRSVYEANRDLEDLFFEPCFCV